MKQALQTTLLILVLIAVSGAGAPADELVLKNGDRLQGPVKQAGDDFVVEHPVLGTVTVPGKDVTKVVRGSSAAAVAAAAAAPAATPAACTRCPLPTAEVGTKAKRPWTFWIGLGLSDENGNTDKFGINVDMEGSYTWGKNTVRARLNSFYEEAQGVQTEGKYFASAGWRRQVSSRGFIFAKWLFDRDDFADILYRTGVFVGYGYDFIQREKTTLSGALGAGWMTESRKSQDEIHTAALIARAEFNHEFRGGDTFRAMYYIIPYLDYTELSPMRLELQYAHPLRKNLDLAVSFLMDYVPEPPDPIKPYDTKLVFSVRWKP